MQRQDLVADDVVARSDVGNLDVPGEFVLDEVGGSPDTGVAARLPPRRGNLCPAKAGGVDGVAARAAVGHVFLDGANMGFGPCVPDEGCGVTGIDGHGETVALARLVANDGRSAEGIGGDKAVVKVIGLPAYGGGDGVLVLEGCIPALVLLAADEDTLDVAVGCHKGRNKEEEGKHGEGKRRGI